MKIILPNIQGVKRNNDIAFFIIICMVIFPFITYIFDGENLLSSPASIALSSVLLSAAFIYYFSELCRKADLFILTINITVLFMNNVLYPGIGCILTYYNILILLLIFNNLSFTKNQVQSIRITVAIALLFFLLSLKITQGYGINLEDINGNRVNPNTFGVMTLAMYFNFLAFIDATKLKPFYKFVIFILMTYISIYYIEFSESRSSYIAIIAFVIMYFIKFWKMKNYRIILLITMIIALILPFIYITVMNNFSGIEFMGKSVGSRDVVWKSAIDYIKQYPILGSGTKYLMLSRHETIGYTYTSSAHNTFLGFWKTIGIIPTLTFIWYAISQKNMKEISKINSVAKKMFLSCIIICAFETIINDSDTYIFFLILLMNIDESIQKYEFVY